MFAKMRVGGALAHIAEADSILSAETATQMT